MPYTHGLISALIWAVAFGALYMLVRRGSGLLGQGVVLALAVFSHWLADLIVHVPDLPVFVGEPKLDFGLWNNFWASQSLEFGLLIISVVWYLRRSKPINRMGMAAPWMLFALLLGVQAFSHLPNETVPTSDMFAIQALFAYSLFAGLAYWTEQQRAA